MYDTEVSSRVNEFKMNMTHSNIRNNGPFLYSESVQKHKTVLSILSNEIQSDVATLLSYLSGHTTKAIHPYQTKHQIRMR